MFEVPVPHVQKPEAWLKKQLDIINVTISLEPKQATHVCPPLLRCPQLQVACLAPIFLVVSSAAAVEGAAAVISVSLDPLEAAIDDQQVQWLKTFAAELPAALQKAGKWSKPSCYMSVQHV